jgi:phosphoenolpyruvate synthase/pyruvate phosphate dikinase
MSTLTRFDEILEAIAKMPPEDQESLIAIVERRRIAQRRAALARDVQEARDEFQGGRCLPQDPKNLMKEILS